MDLRNSFRSLFGRRLSQRKRTTIYRDEVYGDETDQKVDLVDDDPQSCFYHLGNLSQDNVAFLVQSSNSLQGFSQRKPLLVLKSICIYLRATKKMSTKHRLRINRILAIVIRLADHIDGNMANILMEEAINDLVKITEFQDLYQDAAVDILVALWHHFPELLFTKLLQCFQGQLLLHHGTLKILGKLADKNRTSYS
ncbi:maestro heat-like repeat family member 5 isoform X1 [Paroedura picta]|uniref:maestro heat-like repeat family member 5 isoform X1 n=1 Tax=Paroedura picta TaxID=143630 RepID=UPI004056CDA1